MPKSTLLVILGAMILAAAIALNTLVDWDGQRREEPATSASAPATAPALQPPPLARRPVAPSFDVVRINPNGDAVIAGRAAPGAEVTVMDGETAIGRVQADKRGEWVLVPDKPVPPGTRTFSLTSKLPDQEPVTSESEVVLVVPEHDGAGGALVLRVPRGGDEPSAVLQSPFPSGGTSSGGVTIGVIDYDENGKAAVSGRAKPGAQLNVYLDDKLVGSARADQKGEWKLALPVPISPGEHRLRIDDLDAAGKVAGRAEYGFARKAPAEGGLPAGAVVVVESGNNLWRIARRTYGRGTQYTLIVEANRDQIKDPDLIYPGQVFELPRRR